MGNGDQKMKRVLAVLAFTVALGACAQKSVYEAAVQDREPVYCYKSLAGVVCHETPNFRDERRMVNYFGPAPKRYDRPAPPPEQKLFAPEPINYWVKDPEPLPRAKPHGDLADRPWVTMGVAGALNHDPKQAARIASEREVLAGTSLVDAEQGSPGTAAFLTAISNEAVGRDRIEIDTAAGPQ
jgi:hypothetical protein